MPLKKLKSLFVPEDGRFFELMQKQAVVAHKSANALSELFKDHAHLEKHASKIRELEHEGDQLMRDIYLALNKTFIVPIDHSDISGLAGSLDDIIDLIDEVAALLPIYRINAPSPAMEQMARILVDQTEELKGAVDAINHSRTYSEVAKHCTRIKSLESRADEIYYKSLGELFGKEDALEIVKQKEILERLEAATDKVDKTAQHISDIVMKHS
ncbi:DUF47 family protein [Candidatus Micrarchaeota archaeon]|nr:DUF47 family protein [Candidatus Micrarchaeota archaeon]